MGLYAYELMELRYNKLMQKKLNYQGLNDELEVILSQLQSGSLDIDEALDAYERGQVIVKELQDFLKKAENKIKKLPPA